MTGEGLDGERCGMGGSGSDELHQGLGRGSVVEAVGR